MQHEFNVNVNVHVHGRLTIDVNLNPPPHHPGRAVAIKFALNQAQGENMPGVITVDTTDETATLAFVDDKGDTDAAQPDGSTVTFTSDNEAVATVAADSANPLKADITPVGEGTANITASVAGADSQPLFDDASVVVTVTAGAAVGDSFTLSV